MKILDVSPITDTVRFPIKKGTLKFIQDAHKENTAGVLQALIGKSLGITAYVIYGCKNSGSGLNYDISPGYVFYLGELYYVASAAFTAAGGQTAVLKITTTQYTTDADPVTFSDASSKNVHNIRAVTIASAVSGTGISDYSAVEFANLSIDDYMNIAWTAYSPTITYNNSTGNTTNVSTMEYIKKGKLLIINGKVDVSLGTVSGTASLSFPLPNGYLKNAIIHEEYVNVIAVTAGLGDSRAFKLSIANGSGDVLLSSSGTGSTMISSNRYVFGFSITIGIQ